MVQRSLTWIVLVWVLGVGALSVALKDKVASIVVGLRIPVLVGYYLLVTPLILIEEALTIQVPYFWGIVPMIGAFYLLFLALLGIQRLLGLGWLATSGVCGLLGWVNEFLVVGRIHQISAGVLLAMSLLCVAIYSVMAIVPAAYLHAAGRDRRGNVGR